MAAEGARVAICARNHDAVTATAATLRDESGAEVIGLVADTGTRDGVVGLVERVRETLGPVQVLVNNAATAAGRSRPPALAEITRDALLAEIDVKVLGYLFAAQAVAPDMRAAGWGRIVNIAGLAAVTTGSAIGSIRNVSVAALTKNLADELGPHGVTVNCVHPGMTRTVRPEDAQPDDQPMVSITPTNIAGRVVEDFDLAPLVAFLASPLSFVVNGEMIEAAGGTPGRIRY